MSSHVGGEQEYVQILSSTDYVCQKDIYEDFLESCVEASASEIGYLHLYDATRGEIQLNVWSRQVQSHCRTGYDSHYPLGSAGVWADCVRVGRPAIHEPYSPESGESLPDGHIAFRNHMSIPVQPDGNIIAIVGVGNSAKPYNEARAQDLSEAIHSRWTLVEDALGRLDEREATARREFESHGILDHISDIFVALSSVLEARDRYTSHHQRNVARVAAIIGKAMGFDEHRLYGLKLICLLHDIGKIAIPAEILVKPGKLSEAEYGLIRTHSKIGAEFFKNLKLPWPLAEAILQHHERLDGSGYPRGLHKRDILVEARILAVADTLDAIIMPRPYRPAYPREKAIELLQEGRGQQLDAYAVDALLAALEEDPGMAGIYASP